MATTGLGLDVFGRTDVGRVRERNEDQFLIAALEKSMNVIETSLPNESGVRIVGSSAGIVLLVADGMGGHSAGDRASALVAKTIERRIVNTLTWCLALDLDHEDEFVEQLVAMMKGGHRAIADEAKGHPELRGMGTTATLAYLVGRRLFVVHAGDSRAYLIRGQKIDHLTTDHTVAQQLVEDGVISRRDAEDSPYSHVLWNALGQDGKIEVEVHRARLKEGDVIVLCTDGLTNHVDDKSIRRIVSEAASADEATTELVAAANAGGGADNITAIVARVVDT